MMMNPKLKKRLVDSIEYLRKMDFFQDYSDLTSEEILNKIFNGEINYSHEWWEEREEPKSQIPHGILLKQSLVEYEKDWMKESDAEIDGAVMVFDTKRVMVEEAETIPDDEMGEAILERLARISRGVFQPTNINSRWLTPLQSKWSIQEISFDFKGKRHSIEIALMLDYIEDMGLRELNELIKDTGYQYYQVKRGDMAHIIVVVLTEEEANKLEKERDWSFKYIV
ncbi:MAG: hypothetical protein FGF48_06865 [Candidatus Brockarchaeota archaeon]|nr:hypothetical protein [Candidatus Brockarchaeota archaeon]